MSNWIEVGEKYALVGLSVKFEGALPAQITTSLSAVIDTAFSVPAHWREWLGTIRAGEVEDCNLFLLSKTKSKTLEVLDAENQQLQPTESGHADHDRDISGHRITPDDGFDEYVDRVAEGH